MILCLSLHSTLGRRCEGDLMTGQGDFIIIYRLHNWQGGPDTKSMGPTLASHQINEQIPYQ